MRKYQYTAVNLNKEKVTGIFLAKDEKDLALQLSKQKLYLLEAKKYTGATPSAFFTMGTGQVSLAEITNFCRQCATMLTAGLSIMEAMDVMRKQSFSSYFKSILDVVYDDVKAGMMLSAALNRHEKVFPEFFRSMIFVGEASGKMDIVFNALADYYDNDTAVRKKAKSAMSYPIMLAGLTIAIAIAMLCFIVPTFRDSLSSLDVEATGLTKIVYDASDFVLERWSTILLIIMGILGGIFVFSKTEAGKFFFDSISLKIPLLKDIKIAMITARFAKGFDLLLIGGMDIIEALEAAKVIIGNREMTARYELAVEDVRVGMPITKAFEKHKLFPNLLIQMIAVGEKTAKLDEVLARCGNFFDQQAADTIMTVTSTIQPIMLCMMGGVVGLMFIAIYSPMLSIMQTF